MRTIKISKAINKVESFKQKVLPLTISDLISKESNPFKIWYDELMIDYLSSLSQSQLYNTEYFFNSLNDNTDYQISPKVYTDRYGIDYVYVNIRYKTGGGEKYKLVCFPNFEEFRKILKTQGVILNFQNLIDHLQIKFDLESDDAA